MNNVPILRFKEFNDQWESKPLGELDVVLTRGPFGSALKKEIMVPKEDNTYKVYEQKHAIQKDSTIGEYYISELKYKELMRFSVSPGDFIMSCSGTIGEIFKIPENSEKGVINQALLKLSVGNSINEDFFLYSFRKNLQSLETKGSGIKNITSVKFLKDEFIISFPNIEEQEKIASFFSLIDKKIELQIQKVEELKNYKKGIIEKMFPRNGEIVPELRFAGFSDAWEQRKFGDIFFERREKTKQENEDTLLSCAIDGMFLNSELFSHFRGSTTIGYLKIKKHDLILSTQNLHLGNANVNLRFDSGIISPAYKIFEFVKCDPYFIQSWVKKESTKKFFLACTTEGASICRKNIDWKELNTKKIYVPTLEEQEKIGAFFSNLDKRISLHQDKLQVLNEYKKGLLQQMFI